MQKIVSEPLPNKDYTVNVLNALLLMHRSLYDVLFIVENCDSKVSDVMRARFYILDNCLVRTYEQIDSDFSKACPVMADLSKSLGCPVVRTWKPVDFSV